MRSARLFQPTHPIPHPSTTIFRHLLGLDHVIPLREVPLPLLLLIGPRTSLVLSQRTAHGAGLLRAEVEREVLLLLVEDAQLVALVGVDDGEDAGDGFADVVAATYYPLVSVGSC